MTTNPRHRAVCFGKARKVAGEARRENVCSPSWGAATINSGFVYSALNDYHETDIDNDCTSWPIILGRSRACAAFGSAPLRLPDRSLPGLEMQKCSAEGTLVLDALSATLRVCVSLDVARITD
jgi:hypothetical protein